MAKPITKTFTVTVQSGNGGIITSIAPEEGMPPDELFEGLLGGIAAFYVMIWGSDGDVAEEHLDPDEFSQMVYAKVLTRLESYKVSKATMQ